MRAQVFVQHKDDARPTHPGIRVVRPHEVGWLRRPECDPNPDTEVWELPDGKMYAHDRSQGPLRLGFIRRAPHEQG